MSEETKGKTNGTGTVGFNVRLQAVEHTALPVLANYTHVNVAQGVACVDFGFIEPALLADVGKHSQKGETLPNHIKGSLATRVVLPIDSLIRLQQQLSQILMRLNGEVVR